MPDREMQDWEDRARAVLRSQPLVDGHNDLPWAMRRLANYDMDQIDLAAGSNATFTDLPRLRQGHVGGQFWSVYVPTHDHPEQSVLMTLEQIDFVHRMVARYPDDLVLATKADDVYTAHASGRIASLLGAEGGHSIGNSLAVLRRMSAAGVRYMTLTHNFNTAWADSATDEPVCGGLSAFGIAVVEEMNRLGMLVDLSHVSDATMNQAIAASTPPVIFSHSCCRALVDHPRNVPDDVLVRLADKGGVCMIGFVPEFVSPEYRAWILELEADMNERGLDPRNWDEFERCGEELAGSVPRPVSTVAQVADHVEHVRDLVGVDHVGLGSDFDGCDVAPVGLEDVSRFPRLIAELLRRGWSDAECALAAGGNVLRVMREAEDFADAWQVRAPARPDVTGAGHPA